MSDARVPPARGWARAGSAVSRALRRLRDSFPGRCIESFLELQGIDRAMAIAAQAFTALIPLLLLTSAIAPAKGGNAAAEALIRRFHLTGESAQVVQDVFARSGNGSIGVLSVLLLLFSGVSFARRVQRMYLQAWRLPPRPGIRGSLNAAFGLAALLLEILLLSTVAALFRAVLGGVLTWPTTVLGSLILWTSIPWLLLDRRIHWRRLLPAGALAAFCTACYGIATTVYMPSLIESYSRRYGLFGVTIALIGWLLATALIVVAANVVAAEFDRAEEPWARRLRARLIGAQSDDSASRTSPSVPEQAGPEPADPAGPEPAGRVTGGTAEDPMGGPIRPA